ncbi:hypothetical protein HMI54_009796 [Coelomomyces lativittatus]|nr:hypothetical protein HMI54_009796 [Coelomomyces lativittatus]KAJ1503912.1 hypothetical protein HMI55_002263 [Coelomomyces lativittatus]
MDQFSELIYLFKSNAHLLTLDYVGHGLTPDTKNPSHYTTQALLSDIVEVLRCHVKSHHRASTDLIDSTMPTPTADFKKIPLMIISHSYGCVLATKLASYLKEGALMDYELRSMAFIAPSYRAPWPKAKYIPLWVLSLLRQWDQRGGSDSNSVRRLLGATADKRLKRKQFIWNRHLSTQQLGYLLEGLEWPTDTLYEHMKVPVFVLGGALDHLVPPSHLTALSALVACKDGPVIIPGLGHQLVCQAPEVVHAHVSSFLTQFCPQFYPYTHWTMDSRDKWNLKNLSKWKSTVPMGHVLARLVPMKVLKQDDPEHNPSTLAKLHPELRCIVDLSKDSPPYDTEELSKLGIRYIKVSTVSKQVPTFENVQHFIQVVDDYLTKNPFQIGVHCHYGYNRTGFMIVSYLVEKLGMDVHDAIHAFTAARKPDGIRY